VIAHAARFASAAGLPLEVTRVLDPLLDLVQGPGSVRDIIAEVSKTWREEMAEQVRATGSGAAVTVTVLNPRERIHQAIARVAGEREAAVIAIGSHGAGLIRHTVLGSVAMAVVGEADRPVLIAGPKSAPPAVGEARFTILATDDGSETSRRCISAIAPLLPGTSIDVALLSVYEPRLGDAGEQEEQIAMERGLDELRSGLPTGTSSRALVRTVGDFERVDAAIVRIAAEESADAIAMATQGHSARRHFMVGSVAVGVLKHAPVPVILVRGR